MQCYMHVASFIERWLYPIAIRSWTMKTKHAPLAKPTETEALHVLKPKDHETSSESSYASWQVATHAVPEQLADLLQTVSSLSRCQSIET